jgi:hypothetical protein
MRNIWEPYPFMRNIWEPYPFMRNIWKPDLKGFMCKKPQVIQLSRLIARKLFSRREVNKTPRAEMKTLERKRFLNLKGKPDSLVRIF